MENWKIIILFSDIFKKRVYDFILPNNMATAIQLHHYQQH